MEIWSEVMEYRHKRWLKHEARFEAERLQNPQRFKEKYNRSPQAIADWFADVDVAFKYGVECEECRQYRPQSDYTSRTPKNNGVCRSCRIERIQNKSEAI